MWVAGCGVWGVSCSVTFALLDIVGFEIVCEFDVSCIVCRVLVVWCFLFDVPWWLVIGRWWLAIGHWWLVVGCGIVLVVSITLLSV